MSLIVGRVTGISDELWEKLCKRFPPHDAVYDPLQQKELVELGHAAGALAVLKVIAEADNRVLPSL